MRGAVDHGRPGNGAAWVVDLVAALLSVSLLGCAHQPTSYGEAARRYQPGMTMADATLVYGAPAEITREGRVTKARYHLDEPRRDPGTADAFGIDFEGDAATGIAPLKRR